MKRYFAWKDANCNGENIEWVELSGSEFYALKKENPSRRFITSCDEDDPDSDCYYYETTIEDYNEWNKEQMREARRIEYLEKNYKVVSLDDLVSADDEEGLTWAEIIPDTRDDDELLESQYRARMAWLRRMLPSALQILKKKQLDAIKWLYLDEDGYYEEIDSKTGEKVKKHKSEKEVAEEHGIPEKTLNNRKNARKCFREPQDFQP